MSQELNKVIVTKIFNAKAGNNQDYMVVQAKQIVKRNDQDSIVSMFLGSTNTETKVALQNMHKDVIENQKIEVGTDLSEAFGIQMKIKVTELTTSDYEKLSDQEKLGFQIKRNPETQAELSTPDGENIYRKMEIRAEAEGEEDIRVQHVRVPRNAQVTEEAKAEVVKEEDLTA